MEPHPDRDDQPAARAPGRAPLIAAVVIGGMFLILVVLHLIGSMSLHSG